MMGGGGSCPGRGGCGPRCAAGGFGLHVYERFLRPRSQAALAKMTVSCRRWGGVSNHCTKWVHFVPTADKNVDNSTATKRPYTSATRPITPNIEGRRDMPTDHDIPESPAAAPDATVDAPRADRLPNYPDATD